MPKIVVFEQDLLNYGDLDWNGIRSLGNVFIYDFKDYDKAVNEAYDADIIIINKIIIDSSILQSFQKLRLIVLAATGYDNVDLQACKNVGVKVMNVKGYSKESVAQHVFALLLSELHQVSLYSNSVKDGEWNHRQTFTYAQHTIHALNELTLGIYGYGSIGQQVAQVAKSFGMTVKVSNRSLINHAEVEQMALEELFSECDVISIHVPLTQDTFQIVNANLLARCKENVILINTARGGIINENDLADFLEVHPKAKALLDVLSSEPPSEDNPLLGLDNVTITPHQAWSSLYARKKLLSKIGDCIQRFINKEDQSYLN